MPPPCSRLPGTTYVVERRTERRVHLFRPDSRMNQVFLYCLGVALAQTGMRLMAVVMMSNHYHAIVHDPSGNISAFTERFHGLLTKATQALRGWQGSVFDGGKPSYVELLTVNAMVDETAYVLANPTAAGLVRYSRDWPGVRTRISEIGAEGAISVERPVGAFFADEGAMPERVTLRYEMLEPLLEGSDLDSARARIADAVQVKENLARARLEAEGRTFKGVERVLKSSPYARAKTFEQRHTLNPRYAGDKKAREAAIERDRDFVERYAATRERWLGGERDVVWPMGTDVMRRRHRVRCTPPPE